MENKEKEKGRAKEGKMRKKKTREKRRKPKKDKNISTIMQRNKHIICPSVVIISIFVNISFTFYLD